MFEERLKFLMFHVKLMIFWNEKHFISGEENALKNNVNMFGKMCCNVNASTFCFRVNVIAKYNEWLN